MFSTDKAAIDTTEFVLKDVTRFAPSLQVGSMHDVHEYLKMLLDELDKEMNRVEPGSQKRLDIPEAEMESLSQLDQGLVAWNQAHLESNSVISGKYNLGKK